MSHVICQVGINTAHSATLHGIWHSEINLKNGHSKPEVCVLICLIMI